MLGRAHGDGHPGHVTRGDEAGQRVEGLGNEGVEIQLLAALILSASSVLRSVSLRAPTTASR